MPDEPPSLRAVQRREIIRRSLRRVLVSMLFVAWFSALIGGAPWIRFNEEMGLKNHKYAWGLLSAIPFIGTFFQFLGSYWIERFGRRKSLFFLGFVTQRVTWLGVAAAPLIFAPNTTGAILSVLGLFMLQASTAALAMPAWTSWMADVIPARIRGRYFGLRSQMGLMIIIPVSLTAGWVLNATQTHVLRLPYPTGLAFWQPDRWRWISQPFDWSTLQVCTVFFVIAAVMGVIDLLLFISVPDRAPRHKLPLRLRDLFHGPLGNPRFRRFLLYYTVFQVATPGIGYYVWLYVMNADYVGVGPLWAQAIFMGGGGLGAILLAKMWGRLIDRFGRKTVWRITYFVPVLLPVIYGSIQPSFWYLAFVVAFTDGMFWNGVEQTNFNALLHFSSGDGQARPNAAYQGVYALAMAAAGTVSGLMFGGITWLINHLAALGAEPELARQILSRGWETHLAGVQITYIHVLFLAATLIRVFAYVVLLPALEQDGREPVRAAVGYLFGRTYASFATLATFPWRALGLVATQTQKRRR